MGAISSALQPASDNTPVSNDAAADATCEWYARLREHIFRIVAIEPGMVGCRWNVSDVRAAFGTSVRTGVVIGPIRALGQFDSLWDVAIVKTPLLGDDDDDEEPCLALEQHSGAEGDAQSTVVKAPARLEAIVRLRSYRRPQGDVESGSDATRSIAGIDGYLTLTAVSNCNIIDDASYVFC